MRRAVVILGSGGFVGKLTEENKARLRRGVQEFCSGYYDFIIVTDAFVGGLMRKYLREEYQIFPERILLDDRALDTYGNGEEVRTLCEERDIGEIALVTSDYHLPVAHMIFWFSNLKKIKRVPVEPGNISWKRRVKYGLFYPLYVLLDPYGRGWLARRKREKRQNRLDNIRFAKGAL